MARHKEFDREVVLSKAMDTFWHQGYEATSIQDLVKNMGINRGSLYDTFGDKRSLFLEAIAHYDETVAKAAIASLEAPNASKPAIVALFERVADGVQDRRGCLITNTVVELCPHDPDTARRISGNLKRLERAFYVALKRAQEKGEVGGDRDISALASFLLCSLQGLQVTSKIHPDPEYLRSIVRVAVSALD
ncbi:MAG: TetR/AcrR family transcriptional regulator [Limnospira sp.]